MAAVWRGRRGSVIRFKYMQIYATQTQKEKGSKDISSNDITILNKLPRNDIRTIVDAFT